MHAGGLVGEAKASSAVIRASFAAGVVDATGPSTGSRVVAAGGLVGEIGAGVTVTSSYARGDVDATGTAANIQRGALVGNHGGVGISYSYATGKLTGTASNPANRCGLKGTGSNPVTNSYYNSSTLGLSNCDTSNGTAKTTTELQTPIAYGTGSAIYANWNKDIDNADNDNNTATGTDDPWDFGTANQYPALKYGAQQTSWQWPVVTLSLSPTTIYEAVGGATTSTVTATSTTDWNHDLKVAVPQETTRYTVSDITIPAGSTSATATLTAVNNYNCGSAACSTTNTAKVDYTKTMTLGTNPATVGTTTTTDTWVTSGTPDSTLTITDDDELFQVTGVDASQDGGGIKVDWTKVTNATGYKLCWKSGTQSYDSSRCATAGDVATHTIPESGTRFVAGTTYTLRVQPTKSGADDGLPSAEVTVAFKGWIEVSATSVGVSEPSSGSTTGTYTVKLGSRPANNVTVTITRKSGSHASRPAFSPSSLTFSSTTWNTAQTVTITVTPDLLNTTDEVATLVHTATSSDANYTSIATPEVVATAEDQNAPPASANFTLQVQPDAKHDIDYKNVTFSDADGNTYESFVIQSIPTGGHLWVRVRKTTGPCRLRPHVTTCKKSSVRAAVGQEVAVVDASGERTYLTYYSSPDFAGSHFDFKVKDSSNALSGTYRVTLQLKDTAGAPAGVSATVDDGQATLSWTAPSAPAGKPVTKYQVRWVAADDSGVETSARAAGPWTDVTGSPIPTSYTLTGLDNGTSYDLMVRAVNSAGGGPAGYVGPVWIAPALAAPTGFTASPETGKVVLDWTDPSNNVITGYEYQQRQPLILELEEVRWQAPVSTIVDTITEWEYRIKWTGSSTWGAWTDICLQSDDNTCKNKTSHRIQDSSLASGSNYYVQIRYKVSNTDTDVDALSSTAVATSDSSGDVTVNWVAVSGATGYRYRTKTTTSGSTWSAWADAGTGTSKDITGLAASTDYQVQVRYLKANDEYGLADMRTASSLPLSAKGMRWPAAWTAMSGSTATTVTHDVTTGLADGKTFEFRIRAQKGTGNSILKGRASTGSRVALPTAVPAKPTGLTAVARDLSADLAWTDPSDSSIYKWQYSSDDGTTWTDVPSSTASTASYTVPTLTNGTEYTFKVRAVNYKGNSPASDSVTATPVALPAKPTGLAAAGAGGGTVDLTWDDPGDSSITGWEYRNVADANGWDSVTTMVAAEITPTKLFFTGDNWNRGQAVLVKLKTRPSSTVTVNLSQSGLVFTPSSLEFTTDNWNTTQTVLVKRTSRPVSNVMLRLDNVRLSSNPAITNAVSVVFKPGATMSPSSLTFTTNNWNTVQWVNIKLTERPAASTTINLSQTGVTFSPSSLKFDSSNWNTGLSVGVRLASQPGQSVTLGNPGLGVANLTVSPSSLTFTSANSTTAQSATVKLSQAPVGKVTVSVARTDATVSPSTLTFTTDNWNTAQTISVTPTTSLSQAGLTVSPSSLTFSDDWNTAKSATVKLSAQPSETVTVDVSQTGATVSPSTLTFTRNNWNTAQSISVVLDSDPGTENLTASPSSLTFTSDDWDTAQSATVKLSAAPSETVTVDMSQTGATVSPSTLTFTTQNWNTAQTINVQLAADPGTAGLTANPSSLNFTTLDWDTAQAVNVMLSAAPSETVTVDVSQTGATVSPSTLTFTTQNWNTAQSISVQLATAPSQDTTLTLATTAPIQKTLTLATAPIQETLTLATQAGTEKTLTLATQAGNTSLDWGAPAIVAAKLNKQPCYPCATISLVIPGAAFTPAAIWNSANWNTWQTTTATLSTVFTTIAPQTGPSISPSGGLTFTRDNWSTAQSVTVKLAGRPSASQTLEFAETGVTFSPSSLTFTPTNWNTAQTVSVTLASQPAGNVTVPDMTLGGWKAVPASGATTTSYRVTGLTPSTSNTDTRSFQVRAVNSAGKGPASDQASTTTAARPAKPANLTATAATASATLSWTGAGTSVDHYEYQYKTTGAYGAWTSTGGAATSHTVTGLTGNTLHTFRVRGVNSYGEAGPASDEVTVTPVRLPEAPVILSVEPGNQRLRVYWTPPYDASGLTGFEYRSRTSGTSDWTGSTWTAFEGADGTSVSGDIASLQNSTAYELQIRAVNDIGNGAESATATGTPAAVPDIPSRYGLGVRDGGAELIWTKSDDSTITKHQMRHWAGTSADVVVGKGVATQEITLDWHNPNNSSITKYQYSTDGTTWTDIACTSGCTVGTQTSHTFTANLTDGTQFTYQVRGYVSSTTTVAVTGLRAWTTINPTSGGRPPRVQLLLLATGLTNGTEYTVALRAVNSVGPGLSDRDTVIPVDLPEKPVLTAALDTVIDTSVNLSWSDLNDTTIKKWDYSYRKGTGAWEPRPYICLNTSENPDSTCPGRTSFVVTGLSRGTSYTFRVWARNANGMGTVSDDVTVLMRPAKPAGFTAGARNASVALSWTDPSDTSISKWQLRQWTASSALVVGTGAAQEVMLSWTNPNNSNITKFQFSTDGSTWTDISSSSATTTSHTVSTTLTSGTLYTYQVRGFIAADNTVAVTGLEAWTTISTSATATSHTVTGLTNNTAYSFAVRAVNASGTGPVSDTATATPVTAPSAPGGFTAAAKNASVDLAWTNPNNTTITKWQYRKKEGAGTYGDWTDICETSADSGCPSVTSFTATGLTNGTEHTFQIRAVNPSGDGAASAEATATPFGPPAAPAGFTATARDGSVDLAWTDPANSTITRWQYQQKTSGTWANVGWTDMGTMTVVSEQYQIPNALGTHTKTYSWADPDNSSIEKYQYRKKAGVANWEAWADVPSSSATTTSYTFTGLTKNKLYTFQIRSVYDNSASLTKFRVSRLTNGTAYAFRVRALNASGDGAESAEATATPQPVPTAPTLTTATPGDALVDLAWTYSGSITTTSFQYSSDNGATWTDVPSSSTSTRSYTVTTLTNGTEYTFRVRGVNAYGNGVASNSKKATPIAKPAKPAGFTATPKDTKADLAWTNPNDTSITKWQYRKKEGANNYGDWTDICVTSTDSGCPSVTSFTATGLTNDTEYKFKIRAVNASGDGAESDEATATPKSVPAKPAGFAAAALSLSAKLTWTDPSDSSITRWEYRYKTDGSYGDWTAIPGSTATSTSFTKTGLTNNTAHTFQVRAVNAYGDGPASDEASATPVPAPAAPTGFSATPLSAEVVLAWTNPGNSSITGWQYQQREVGSGGLTAVPGNAEAAVSWTDPSDSAISKWQYRKKEGAGDYGDWTDIPSSSATTTTYTVTGLTNGTEYAIEVRADKSGTAQTALDEVTVTPTADDGWTNVPSSGASTTSHTVTGLTNDTTYKFKIRAVSRSGDGASSAEATAKPIAVPAAPANLTATASTSGSAQAALAWDSANNSSITKWQLRQLAGGSDFVVGAGCQPEHHALLDRPEQLRHHPVAVPVEDDLQRRRLGEPAGDLGVGHHRHARHRAVQRVSPSPSRCRAWAGASST